MNILLLYFKKGSISQINSCSNRIKQDIKIKI